MPSCAPCLRSIPALLFALVLLPAAAPADEAGGGLTIPDVLRLRTVEEVAIAPAGGEIAYVLEVPRQPFEEEDGKAHRELRLVAPGGVSRPYVAGTRVSEIAWNADGREIFFLAKRGDDEHVALWAIPRDGGEARRLFAPGSVVESYALGPEGRLAALASEPEDEARKALRERGFDRVVVEEEERPVRVWIVERGADAEPRPLALDGHARGVAWSPGGDRLAVKVSPGGGPDQGLVATRVWIVDPSSGEVAARLENPGKLGEMAWSPDGRHLAMISAADPADPREGRLRVASASGQGAPGGELRDLLPQLLDRGHVAAFAWRSAGELVFLAQEGVETWLGTVGLDGRTETLLPAGDLVVEKLSLAGNGELALYGSTPEHPDEVFHLAPGGAPQRLTDSNPWLAQTRLAPQEVVRYRARDGLEIEGLLIRPLDAGAAGARHPLLVIVHGGPESHVRNGWITTYSRPGQAAAARGFAVFYPNYRASTGRGVAFSKLDHKDPAGKEFDDLVDGVDHLIAAGLVDGERVGITGGSYGGYATAWAATRFSERFAAAVMSVGISNKTSSLGTSDIPVELYQVHSRRWPWEDWAFFLERSPIAHVEKGRTPILILGGDSDTRVHPAQSLQLYRYLKLLDQTPVRLVVYPGEKHGNERAASRLDFALRLMRWMEHYLIGPGGDPPPPEIDYGPPPEAG